MHSTILKSSLSFQETRLIYFSPLFFCYTCLLNVNHAFGSNHELRCYFLEGVAYCIFNKQNTLVCPQLNKLGIRFSLVFRNWIAPFYPNYRNARFLATTTSVNDRKGYFSFPVSVLGVAGGMFSFSSFALAPDRPCILPSSQYKMSKSGKIFISKMVVTHFEFGEYYTSTKNCFLKCGKSLWLGLVYVIWRVWLETAV